MFKSIVLLVCFSCLSTYCFLLVSAKASSIRWYGHVLRKEDKNVVVKAFKFEVSRSRGRGRPKQTWKKQVENEMKENGLVKEDACDRTKWRGVVKTMTIRNPAYSVDGDNTESNM